jgi:uncharacterized membrane protein YkoI
MKRVIIATGIVAGVVVAGTGIAIAANAGGGDHDSAAEQQAEADFTAAHVDDAAVSRSEAIDTALAAHPGTATDVHLENEGHGLVWEVKPADGTTVYEVQVDAQTGTIVSDQLDE